MRGQPTLPRNLSELSLVPVQKLRGQPFLRIRVPDTAWLRGLHGDSRASIKDTPVTGTHSSRLSALACRRLAHRSVGRCADGIELSEWHLYRSCDTNTEMKTATLPPLRVEPRLRKEVERLLAPGETISIFVERAVRQDVERRAADVAFASKALAAREQSRKTGTYHSAASVLRALRAQVRAPRGRPARSKSR